MVNLGMSLRDVGEGKDVGRIEQVDDGWSSLEPCAKR
jgi:hypothetical protein